MKRCDKPSKFISLKYHTHNVIMAFFFHLNNQTFSSLHTEHSSNDNLIHQNSMLLILVNRKKMNIITDHTNIISSSRPNKWTVFTRQALGEANEIVGDVLFS